MEKIHKYIEMPRKITPYVLAAIVLSFSFFSWLSVNRAIFSKDYSDFWVPLIWFSLFAIGLCLLVVLAKEKIFVRVVLFLSLVPSLFFVWDFLHMLVAIFAWALLFGAEKNINKDIETSTKINLLKSLPRGTFLVVVALAFVICSQYYFSVRSLDPLKMAPTVSKGGAVGGMVNLVLPWISPEFKRVSSEEVSIDDFLGEIYELVIKRESEELKNKMESGADSFQKNQVESLLEMELGRKLTEDEKLQLGEVGLGDQMESIAMSPQIKGEVVSQWKKELSKSAGFEVVGSEKVADIFVAVFNSKVEDFVEVDEKGEKAKLIPIVFSIILLISLVSIGSFVSRLWIPIAALAFLIFRKTGIAKIEKKMVEAEIIA